MDLAEVNSGVSIENGIDTVHVSQVQSVIQPTSVIQSAPSLQTLSTKGNIILVGKPNSVIHTTGIQLVEQSEAGATKKRREILARRPSYRKILNDLGGCEISEDRADSPESLESDLIKQNQTITLSSTQFQTAGGLLKVIPASAIQLATVSSGQGLTEGQSLPTLAMTNTSGGSTIVHYAQGQEGQLFVPVGVAGDVQAYALRPVTSSNVVLGTTSATSTVAQEFSEDNSRKRERLAKGSSGSGGNNSDEWEMSEPALQKREIRLMKNREAARECRRKKKEYIKCLENRVAVLENQNKALIEELKSLKELYCNQKTD